MVSTGQPHAPDPASRLVDRGGIAVVARGGRRRSADPFGHQPHRCDHAGSVAVSVYVPPGPPFV